MLWQCQLERNLGKFYPDLQDPAEYLHQNRMIRVTHADDFLVAGEQEKVTEMMEALSKEFRMTVKDALDGKEHTFLGRSMRWIRPGHVPLESDKGTLKKLSVNYC